MSIVSYNGGADVHTLQQLKDFDFLTTTVFEIIESNNNDEHKMSKSLNFRFNLDFY